MRPRPDGGYGDVYYFLSLLHFTWRTTAQVHVQLDPLYDRSRCRAGSSFTGPLADCREPLPSSVSLWKHSWHTYWGRDEYDTQWTRKRSLAHAPKTLFNMIPKGLSIDTFGEFVFAINHDDRGCLYRDYTPEPRDITRASIAVFMDSSYSTRRHLHELSTL